MGEKVANRPPNSHKNWDFPEGGGRSPILARPPASAHALGAFYHHVRVFFVTCFSLLGAFSPCGGLYVSFFYLHVVGHFCPYRGPFLGLPTFPTRIFEDTDASPYSPMQAPMSPTCGAPMHTHTKYMYLLISIYRILYGK